MRFILPSLLTGFRFASQSKLMNAHWWDTLRCVKGSVTTPTHPDLALIFKTVSLGNTMHRDVMMSWRASKYISNAIALFEHQGFRSVQPIDLKNIYRGHMSAFFQVSQGWALYMSTCEVTDNFGSQRSTCIMDFLVTNPNPNELFSTFHQPQRQPWSTWEGGLTF